MEATKTVGAGALAPQGDAWGFVQSGGETASGGPNSRPTAYREVVDLSKFPGEIWQSWSLQVFEINPWAAWPDLQAAHSEQEAGAETPSSHPSLHNSTKYRADHLFPMVRTNRVNLSEAA